MTGQVGRSLPALERRRASLQALRPPVRHPADHPARIPRRRRTSKTAERPLNARLAYGRAALEAPHVHLIDPSYHALLGRDALLGRGDLLPAVADPVI
jgi:hypothetical protein